MTVDSTGMDDAVVEELFAAGIELSMTVTVTAGMLLVVLLESSSVAKGGCLPWPSNVKVVEVVSMMAGESADVGEDAASGGGGVADAVDDSTVATAATAGGCGDCDEDSVLELECCCCGSDLVSDILRAALCLKRCVVLV